MIWCYVNTYRAFIFYHFLLMEVNNKGSHRFLQGNHARLSSLMLSWRETGSHSLISLIRDANFQVGLRDLLELQQISRWQRSSLMDKFTALEIKVVALYLNEAPSLPRLCSSRLYPKSLEISKPRVGNPSLNVRKFKNMIFTNKG